MNKDILLDPDDQSTTVTSRLDRRLAGTRLRIVIGAGVADELSQAEHASVNYALERYEKRQRHRVKLMQKTLPARLATCSSVLESRHGRAIS